MAQGIILAGGFSSRTQTNKMCLLIDGKPMIIHTIEAMKPFVTKIIVVTGHFDQEIRKVIKEDETIQIVYNKDYTKGMFSSVLCGVKYVNDDFFIVPGDIPFISADTYQTLLKGTKPVRYPTYQEKDGHPLFIKKELIAELLKEDLDSNLRLFRDKQSKETMPVNDKNILKDIDTLEDYQNVIAERN